MIQQLSLMLAFLFKKKLCSWMFYLRVCLCSTCLPGTQGIQRRASDPLTLELQTVVSLHLGTRTITWSCGRAVDALNCWGQLAISQLLILTEKNTLCSLGRLDCARLWCIHNQPCFSQGGTGYKEWSQDLGRAQDQKVRWQRGHLFSFSAGGN